MLITNRKGTRWVIPKGIVEPELTALQSAEKEAFEEAGIEGRSFDESLGEFSYEKWGGLCVVEVFPLEVKSLAEDWPEACFREREWVTPEEAVRRVREPELKNIIRKFANRYLSVFQK